MLFSQSNKPLSNTQTTLANSTIKHKPIKKDNFFVFMGKRIWGMLSWIWARFRKVAWIGSTGKYINY